MFNVALVAFAVGLLWVAISLLGILYPFPPFRTRKRAFFSAGIALAAVLADATLTAIFVERPDPSSTTATAPAPIPPKTETAAAPVDTFSDSSFQWDDDTAKFKPQIITIVNRIAKENTDCPDPDPMSVALSNESKPNAPVFFVMCGSGKDVFSISFSPADADKKEPFAATPPISQSDAADACEAVAKRNRTLPCEPPSFCLLPCSRQLPLLLGPQTTFSLGHSPSTMSEYP